MKAVKNTVGDFMDFIREQGVVGLAVAFILGGAIAKVVSALITDLISPIIGLLLGAAGNLREMYFMVGPAKFMWGDFISTVIDFLVVAGVVYVGVKKLGLDRLDRKKA